MSHVIKAEATTPESAIYDLDIVELAAKRCGLELRRDQKTFRVYGGPQNCLHAVGIPNDRTAYEIGLVKSQQHENAFAMAYDEYDGKLEQFAGSDLGKLRQGLHAEKARKQARAQGDFYKESLQSDGSLVIEIDTSVRAGV